MACEKEEHLVNKNNEQLPQNPKDTVQNKFIFQWDTLIDDSKNDDEFFIGNQYIGYPYVLPFINGFFKNLFKSLNVNFIDASWFISDIVNKIIWDSCNGTIGIIIFIHK